MPTSSYSIHANFVEKIYGFILGRDGSNIPEEHYVGRLRETVPRRKDRSKIPTRPLGAPEFQKQGAPLQPDISNRERLSGSPKIGEIVLCLFRKHFLVGCLVETRRNGRLVLVTKDQRNIVVRRNTIVYLTGVSVGNDRGVLHTYASSVRGVAEHIDLVEIWQLFRRENKALTISDLAATLYWEGEVHPSRWIALYIHLESICPYFESRDRRIYKTLMKGRPIFAEVDRLAVVAKQGIA
ncbi:MAG TPA: hypothetical protein DIU35_12190 [Candidatus Latescibacteria bacterium]|nr:hypothetical protein [Gemmatimonadota bacterium]HCR18233.1 hypothetical protein [Candidatus Latescibacterota bacterium]